MVKPTFAKYLAVKKEKANIALDNLIKKRLLIDHDSRSFSSARFCVIGELRVNFGQNANHKCKEINL